MEELGGGRREQRQQKAAGFCMMLFHRGDSSGASEAYFGKGTKLTVLEKEVQKPTYINILKPSPKECTNQKTNTKKKTLVCVASGFYPDHVTVSWKINEETATRDFATDTAEKDEKGLYKITSRLRVSGAQWENPDNSFTCTVSFFDSKTTINSTKTINGVNKAEEKLTRVKYLRITQTAKLSYGVFIVKSCIYGVFVGFLVWKLQTSSGKQNS